MINAKLPRLIREDKYGKNIITHVLCEELNVAIQEIHNNNKGLLAVDQNGNEIYIVKKNSQIYRDKDYVIYSNETPTLNKIRDNSLELTWINHPLKQCKVEPRIVLESWQNSFNFKEEDLEKNQFGLRTPQIGSIHAVLSHLKVADSIGTVVMPTGTGKTETMLSLLIANKCNKLLVTVSTDPLREQLANKFINLGLLKQFEIVNKDASFPIVGILYEKFDSKEEFIDFVHNCNVIITTMKLVADSDPEIQNEFSKLISNFFIDEAHHVTAPSWLAFRDKFSPKKIIQFTATPFRNDGKKLGGKIIFNYPLKKAQEEGYFKKINFKPIHEYLTENADKAIAEEAVKVLKQDIEKGYNHILMARCSNTKRANEVLNYYKEYKELNPVQIHTGINLTDRKVIKQRILKRECKIIVCVDMLGEGFDLPELKIAAFHDIRKSLPITLQLAGRFTRTKYDEELGEATFIVNIADLDTKEELEELYAQDADWNLLLPQISTNQIEQEINFEEVLKGFHNIDKSNISFQNIRPALSAVAYRSASRTWNPNNYKEGLTSKDEVIFSDINHEENMLVIITVCKKDIKWGVFKDVQDLEWNIIIALLDEDTGLLLIHGSDNNTLHTELAQALLGKNAKRIDKLDIFKAFHDINRVKLQNVGLKEYLGKHIRFRMMVGSDVEEALSLAEKQKGEKAFVFGIGYEKGMKTSLGCSYKGRIWSKLNGDLKQLSSWCKKIAKKLVDPDIDPNLLLRDTLIPKLTTNIPNKYPVWIDWDEALYMEPETKISFSFNESSYDFFNCEINLAELQEEDSVTFVLSLDTKLNVDFKLRLFGDDDNPDFSIEASEPVFNNIKVLYGLKEYNIKDFFYKYTPTLWFVDGSALTGNEYVELKQQVVPYPRSNIKYWSWDDVDLSKESQGVYPKITDSIQYHFIQELKKKDYDVIYDDDYSGEIADVITIKQFEDKIKVELYHLKFAINGRVSTEIKNLYEVCGQAQKSVKWKFKDRNEFFDHLLRRKIKSRNGHTCSRIEKGDENKLKYFSQITKKRYPVEFEIFIVQPGLSREDATNEQLTLLAVTDNYLKEIAAINLNVIASEKIVR